MILLSGTLKDRAISNLLQMFALSGKTGALGIIHNGDHGNEGIGLIFFKAGQITRVELDGLPLLHAIGIIHTWEDVFFEFAVDVPLPQQNYFGSTEELILAGKDMLNEWNIYKSSLLSFFAVPCPGKKWGANSFPLSPAHDLLRPYIDGFSSILSITLKTEFYPLFLCKLLSDLLLSECITFGLASADTEELAGAKALEELDELQDDLPWTPIAAAWRRSKKIVVCDDDPNIPRIMQIALRKSELEHYEGCEVKVVNNSEYFIPVIKQERPNLVLLEIAMPEIDGIALCKELMRHPSVADTPVVFMGLHPEVPAIATACPGFAGYLRKPFTRTQLRDAVAKHSRVV